MCKLARMLTIATVISFCPLYAQQAPLSKDPRVHALEHEMQSRRWKLENGLLISWLGLSTDAAANQVEIFDVGGRMLTNLHVLGLVPEAAGVSVYDVSARLGQTIALGAVFRKKGAPERPADTLLVFDFGGKLTSAFSLEPSREISRIAIDAGSNIWTLTMHSGERDPSKVPMVVEYDRSGNTEGEVLTRGMFPLQADIQQENSNIGSVGSGFESGVFWFWLPGLTELVTIQTSNGASAITNTGLPGANMVPMQVVRQRSGHLIAEIHGSVENGSPGIPLYYVWSTTKSWARFDAAACGGHRLLGTDGEQVVFFNFEDRNVCRLEVP